MSKVINYLNVAAYVLNAAVTYSIGVLGIFGAKTNTELSEKYATLVTPAGFTFAIWSIIFLSQLVFALVQLFVEPFQSKALLVKGVGYNYLGVCAAQIVWTIAFSYEIIWLSLIFMITILYFLMTIFVNQYKLLQQEPENDASNIKDFWLLQFPFSIHCGWILAASLVNLSVVLVKYSVAATGQFYVALASLVLVSAISLLNLLLKKPQFVIPSVLAWASFGIYSQLKNPNELITKTFSDSVIAVVQNGTLGISIGILVAILVRLIITFVRARSSDRDTEENAYDYIRQDED